MTLTYVTQTQAPYRRFYSKIPDVAHLRSFGCVAFVHLNKHERQGAFSPRARKVVFVGYNQEQGSKNWILYDPHNWKVIELCHTTIWENVRWNNKQVSPDWKFLKEDIIAKFLLDLARREDGDKEHCPEEGEGDAQEQEIPLLLHQNRTIRQQLPKIESGDITLLHLLRLPHNMTRTQKEIL